MPKFIYVFNKSEKEKFIQKGFTLMKGDERSDIYVFLNQGQNLNFCDASYALSDTIAF